MAPNSAAQRAGILPGDRLVGISGDDEGEYEQVSSAADVPVYLEEAGVGGQLSYFIERPSFPPETRFYYADLFNLHAIPNLSAHDRVIVLTGLVYLFVGLFVLFKQGGGGPFTLHFATLCVVAFVFHFYKPLGAYEDLDLAIAFLDDAALTLFGPLFVHFCALYPHGRRQMPARWRVPLTALLYAPAVVLADRAALFTQRSRGGAPAVEVGGMGLDGRDCAADAALFDPLCARRRRRIEQSRPGHRTLADRLRGAAAGADPTDLRQFRGALPPDGCGYGGAPHRRVRADDAGYRPDAGRDGFTLRAFTPSARAAR